MTVQSCTLFVLYKVLNYFQIFSLRTTNIHAHSVAAAIHIRLTWRDISLNVERHLSSTVLCASVASLAGTPWSTTFASCTTPIWPLSNKVNEKNSKGYPKFTLSVLSKENFHGKKIYWTTYTKVIKWVS